METAATIPPWDFQPIDLQHPYESGGNRYAGVFGDATFELIASVIIVEGQESTRWCGRQWSDPSCGPDLQRMIAAGFLQRDARGRNYLTNNALYMLAERCPVQKNIPVQVLRALRRLSAPIEDLLDTAGFPRSCEAIDSTTYMAEHQQRVFPCNMPTLDVTYTLSIAGRQSDEVPGVVSVTANLAGRGYDRDLYWPDLPAKPEVIAQDVVPEFQRELEKILAELGETRT
jgi:hypothetical protein